MSVALFLFVLVITDCLVSFFDLPAGVWLIRDFYSLFRFDVLVVRVPVMLEPNAGNSPRTAVHT